MWVSRVDEIENKKDSVQVTNPFMMKNNAQNLRTPLKMQTSAVSKLNSVPDSSKEIGVIVTLSGQRGGSTHSYATSLSGIDINLFAAD